MGRTLKITLTEDQYSELENGYKFGNSHAFRQRCRMVLLKSAGKLTKDICEIVDIKSQNQINIWVKRYQTSYSKIGIDVLHNTSGQGRKAIFNIETDSEKIKKVVQQERQKLSNAKDILEKELNKSFNIKTLKNFLKVLTADTSELDVM